MYLSWEISKIKLPDNSSSTCFLLLWGARFFSYRFDSMYQFLNWLSSLRWSGLNSETLAYDRYDGTLISQMEALPIRVDISRYSKSFFSKTTNSISSIEASNENFVYAMKIFQFCFMDWIFCFLLAKFLKKTHFKSISTLLELDTVKYFRLNLKTKSDSTAASTMKYFFKKDMVFCYHSGTLIGNKRKNYDYQRSLLSFKFSWMEYYLIDVFHQSVNWRCLTCWKISPPKPCGVFSCIWFVIS